MAFSTNSFVQIIRGPLAGHYGYIVGSDGTWYQVRLISRDDARWVHEEDIEIAALWYIDDFRISYM